MGSNPVGEPNLLSVSHLRHAEHFMFHIEMSSYNSFAFHHFQMTSITNIYDVVIEMYPNCKDFSNNYH